MSDDLLHPLGERHRPEVPSAVLALTGDLDLGTTAAAWAEIEGVISGGCRDLVVDLSAVRFCDVSGVNVLLRARSVLAARGGRLRLRGVDEQLGAMLATLGVADRLASG